MDLSLKNQRREIFHRHTVLGYMSQIDFQVWLGEKDKENTLLLMQASDCH